MLLRYHLPLLFLLSLFFGACSGLPEPAAPQLFAAQTVSVGNVYRGAFTPDGQALYFFKKEAEGTEEYRIYRSSLADTGWAAPVPVVLGGDHSDLYPTISPEGDRLVFSSYRPLPGDTARAANANLWMAERAGAGWGPPQYLASLSTPSHYDAKPTFGPDGALYYESTTPDWQTTRSLVARPSSKGWAAPRLFDAVERWRGWRPDLSVWGGVLGPGGALVVLDVSPQDPETGRLGPSDQWVSLRSAAGDWSTPVPFDSTLNGPGYDNFTFFSPDGQQLFFVRDFDQIYSIPVSAALARLPKDTTVR